MFLYILSVMMNNSADTFEHNMVSCGSTWFNVYKLSSVLPSNNSV